MEYSSQLLFAMLCKGVLAFLFLKMAVRKILGSSVAEPQKHGLINL